MPVKVEPAVVLILLSDHGSASQCSRDCSKCCIFSPNNAFGLAPPFLSVKQSARSIRAFALISRRDDNGVIQLEDLELGSQFGWERFMPVVYRMYRNFSTSAKMSRFSTLCEATAKFRLFDSRLMWLSDRCLEERLCTTLKLSHCGWRWWNNWASFWQWISVHLPLSKSSACLHPDIMEVSGTELWAYMLRLTCCICLSIAAKLARKTPYLHEEWMSMAKYNTNGDVKGTLQENNNLCWSERLMP